jgi:enterochelin esterase-like enzyme
LKTAGTPLVETIPGDTNHVLLTFLYRGGPTTSRVNLDAQLVRTRDEVLNLTRIAHSNVWYKTFWIRNDMRFGYALNSARDPLNPKFIQKDADRPSIVDLPKAAPYTWVDPKPGTTQREPVEQRIQSKILNAERTAWIYTPPGYDARRAAPYPVLICFDGPLYASNSIPVHVILDNLITASKIPPMLAIFIGQFPQPQRNIELSNNAPFADFVAQELLPAMRQKWRITSSPAETIVCGSSAGGLASLYFAFHRPDVFGNVLAQSAALWPGKTREDTAHEWLTAQYESSPKLPIRIVLQPGLLEVVQTPLNGPSILDSNRHLRDVLMKKGYQLYYSESAGGHEPLTWRGGIAPGLIQLMGKSATPSNAADHPPVDAVAGIVAAFAKHPVVIIAEWRHEIQQMGDLYIRLVNDPAFQNTVQDIVIEFGSRQNQPLIDRYIGGENVPMEEVRHIWRDTTKVASWESPIYANWLTAIRDVNRKLPPAKRFRVLAGDTAVDWSRMKTQSDWTALGDNNVSFSDVILNQVLAKKRHALVVLGSNHVTKTGDRNGGSNTTTMVEARYPGSTYVTMLWVTPDRPAGWNPPVFYDLAGTSLDVRFTDAWIYVGPQDSLITSKPPAGSLDAEYMKEVDRRSMIEWGELRGRKFLGDAVAK